MPKAKTNQKVEVAIMNAELDTALAAAKTNPKQGVEMVIDMLNRVSDNSIATQNIMDGATERGFNCEFWPVAGGMCIRVQFIPKEG
jgi:hypothetical protein